MAQTPPSSIAPELLAFRTQIDGLDRELLALLNRRASLGHQSAAHGDVGRAADRMRGLVAEQHRQLLARPYGREVVRRRVHRSRRGRPRAPEGEHRGAEARDEDEEASAGGQHESIW